MTLATPSNAKSRNSVHILFIQFILSQKLGRPHTHAHCSTLHSSCLISHVNTYYVYM